MNWRDRSQPQSEASTKDKANGAESKRDSERSAEQKVSVVEEHKETKAEEKVKVNGDAKSPDEKPGRPVTEEKPADTIVGKTKCTEEKEEPALEN